MPYATPLVFVPGRRYSATSACDSNVVWTFELVRRTNCFLYIVQIEANGERGRQRTVGVKQDDDGNEFALPLGKFSMAPVIRGASQYGLPDASDVAIALATDASGVAIALATIRSAATEAEVVELQRGDRIIG